jgi:microcystin-dependent protein
MTHPKLKTILASLPLAFAIVAHAQGTAFNYTGYLLNGATPANGSNDLQFTIFASQTGGTPLTGGVTLTNQPVNNGVFVATLDFGPGIFNGSDRWLEIAGRNGGTANPFTTISPRQKITSVPYASYAGNGAPPGSIMAFMGTNVPPGWLLCDGSVVSRATYAGLFAVVGSSSGAGDGTTTFSVPDLRGMFLRGNTGTRADAFADPDSSSRTNTAPGGNAGNAIGSAQPDAFISHSHFVGGANVWAGGPYNTGFAFFKGAYGNGQVDPSLSGESTTGVGGNETRPKNISVNYIIKY